MIPTLAGVLEGGFAAQTVDVTSSQTVAIPTGATTVDIFAIGGGSSASGIGAGGNGAEMRWILGLSLTGHSGIFCAPGAGGLAPSGTGGDSTVQWDDLTAILVAAGAAYAVGGTGSGGSGNPGGSGGFWQGSGFPGGGGGGAGNVGGAGSPGNNNGALGGPGPLLNGQCNLAGPGANGSNANGQPPASGYGGGGGGGAGSGFPGGNGAPGAIRLVFR